MRWPFSTHARCSKRQSHDDATLQHRSSQDMTSTSSERYTIVCPDLSENCLGRALVLAELASSWGETRIVGFQMEDKIWEPARSVGFEIASYRLQRASDRFKATAWLRKQLSGTKVI